jgi:hypothetical protein
VWEETTVGYSRAFALLRAGVPLTLIIDLWPREGPGSAEIMRREGAAPLIALGAA